MARFIVANRLAGVTERQAPRAALDGMERALGAHFDVRADNKPSEPQARRRIYLETDAAELERARKEFPEDVIVEPQVLRHPALSYPGLVQLELAAQGVEPAPAGIGRTLAVNLRGAGKPLIGAQTTLLLADLTGRGPGTRVRGTSGRNGEVELAYDPTRWWPTQLLVEPRSGFWDWWQVFPQHGMTIDLPALPKVGPLSWWHLVVGMGRYARNRGDGIRIGVVDTGVGPHPYLSHVKSLGSTAGDGYDPSPEAGADVQQHGTHVSGIIAARPVDGSGDYGGIADGADVMAVRVFPPDGAADQGGIAEAIDLLAAEHEADLINLSLGSPQPSAIERDAIIAAAERGTLCCAAAGNSFGGPTMYPAAYPETAAVSALGLAGTSPPGTMAAHAAPLQADKFAPGGLFLADFSNLGPEILCAAPGVGIISTVPARAEVVAPYAGKSGTSMASPIACAALATLLSHDQAYMGLPRGVRRVQRAAAMMAASLQPVGLSPLYVGGGLSRAWPI